MIPFLLVLPELAVREVRYVQVLRSQDASTKSVLPADEGCRRFSLSPGVRGSALPRCRLEVHGSKHLSGGRVCPQRAGSFRVSCSARSGQTRPTSPGFKDPGRVERFWRLIPNGFLSSQRRRRFNIVE